MRKSEYSLVKSIVVRLIEGKRSKGRPLARWIDTTGFTSIYSPPYFYILIDSILLSQY